MADEERKAIIECNAEALARLILDIYLKKKSDDEDHGCNQAQITIPENKE